MKITAEAKAQQQLESLNRAVNGKSFQNEMLAIVEFESAGFTDVRPRENVFTFNAWKALGRVVKKGEHGVKVVTWIPIRTKETDENGEQIVKTIPKTTTLFHVNQTEPLS